MGQPMAIQGSGLALRAAGRISWWRLKMMSRVKKGRILLSGRRPWGLVRTDIS